MDAINSHIHILKSGCSSFFFLQRSFNYRIWWPSLQLVKCVYVFIYVFVYLFKPFSLASKRSHSIPLNTVSFISALVVWNWGAPFYRNYFPSWGQFQSMLFWGRGHSLPSAAIGLEFLFFFSLNIYVKILVMVLCQYGVLYHQSMIQ